jgi:hypothetical protein
MRQREQDVAKKATETSNSLKKLHFGNQQNKSSDLDAMSEEQLQSVIDEQNRVIKSLKTLPKTPEVATLRTLADERLREAQSVKLDKSNSTLADTLDNLAAQMKSTAAINLAKERVDELQEKWSAVITAMALIFNSLLFRHMVTRKYRGKHWAGAAHVLHLYLVGAYLMPVIALDAVLSVIVEYLTRFKVDSHDGFALIAQLFILIISLFSLRKCAKVISCLDSASTASIAPRYKVVSNRLLISNFVTNIVVWIVLSIVLLPIFIVVYKRALNAE